MAVHPSPTTRWALITGASSGIGEAFARRIVEGLLPHRMLLATVDLYQNAQHREDS